MKSSFYSLKINLGLLFSGLIVMFSGLLIQINYHMVNHGGTDINKAVWSLSRTEWSMIHKISIIIFSIFMAYHIILHWQWFKAVISKKLISKNKLIIMLSFVFILVAITGYIPWLVSLICGDNTIREAFVEIHDKIALIFIGILILHILKKLKWFKAFLKKRIPNY